MELRYTSSIAKKVDVKYSLNILAHICHTALTITKENKKFNENILMDEGSAKIKRSAKEKLTIIKSINSVISFKIIVVLMSTFFIR